MNKKLELRVATRTRSKLRIGLFGPSGSGKTYSALLLARGLVSDWEKVAVIDTEYGSADMYSHLGPYNVISLEAPYSPERYIEAIHAAEDAGMQVIIVDSITHEWNGVGGILEISDQLSVAAKNSFSVWTKLTPRHNRFIDAMTQSPVHIIACARTKQDYVLNQVEKSGKMVNVPEKVGLKAITREGFEYEMTISFDLAINHFSTTSKDRTGLFMGRPEFQISEATGKELHEWNMQAKEAPRDYSVVKRKIVAEMERLGKRFDKTKPDEFRQAVVDTAGMELKEENFDTILETLKGIEASSKNNDELEIEDIDFGDPDLPTGGSAAGDPKPEGTAGGNGNEPPEKNGRGHDGGEEKPSPQAVTLMKSLLETKEKIKKDDEKAQLDWLKKRFAVGGWDQLTQAKIVVINKALMNKSYESGPSSA